MSTKTKGILLVYLASVVAHVIAGLFGLTALSQFTNGMDPDSLTEFLGYSTLFVLGMFMGAVVYCGIALVLSPLLTLITLYLVHDRPIRTALWVLLFAFIQLLLILLGVVVQVYILTGIALLLGLTVVPYLAYRLAHRV